MNSHNWMKKFLAVLGSALIGLMLATGANALNPESAVVNVAFVAPLTITKTGDLEFGLLDVAMIALEEVIIEPDNNVIDLSGRVVGGSQTAATFETQGTAGRLITILITSPVSGADYSFGAWQCDYDGGLFGDCGAGMPETTAGGTIIVRVGVVLIADGGASEGDDPGSFSLSLVYQ